MIRVLLVEDEEMTMNLLKIIVNWEEFQMKIVGCASNGQAALFMIPEAKPDIVITDIKMPIMDGLKLSEEIRNQYPNIKVMLVTAYDDIRFAQEAMRAGAVDFILKPLSGRKCGKHLYVSETKLKKMKIQRQLNR